MKKKRMKKKNMLFDTYEARLNWLITYIHTHTSTLYTIYKLPWPYNTQKKTLNHLLQWRRRRRLCDVIPCATPHYWFEWFFFVRSFFFFASSLLFDFRFVPFFSPCALLVNEIKTKKFLVFHHHHHHRRHRRQLRKQHGHHHHHHENRMIGNVILMVRRKKNKFKPNIGWPPQIHTQVIHTIVTNVSLIVIDSNFFFHFV